MNIKQNYGNKKGGITLKNKIEKIAITIVGIALMMLGLYNLYMGFEGTNKKNDNIAKTNAVMIGESISDKDGIEFCVTSVDNTPFVGEGFSKVTTDNNFVIISIRITNDSKDAYDVNTLRFILTEDGKEYEYCADAILSVEKHMYIDTINPGLSKEYVIVYETPFVSQERECQLKISSNSFSDKDCVYINL